MSTLATVIRDRWDALLDEYDRRLQEHPAYAAMPAQSRREAAQRTLSLAADWLHSGDDASFIQFIHASAKERVEQGLDIMMMEQAVRELGVILDPLIEDVETAKLVWHTLYQAQAAVAQQIIEMCAGQVPMRDAAGNVTAVLGMYEDVAQRKRAEEAQRLEESEREYRTLYESTSDAVMLMNGRSFFDCNPATLRMFNCETKEQFLGKHPSEFSPPLQPGGQDSGSLSQQRIETALREGTCRFEWIHRRLDGADFPAEVWLTTMELGGEKVLQAVVRDITERKRSEAQLERSLRETRVRLEISQALAGAETEDEVLDVLIRQAGLYPQAQVAIFTLDMTASEPTFIPCRNNSFESGLPGPSADMRLPASSNPRLYRSLSANRPFVLDNVLTDDEMIDPKGREELGQLGVNSFVAVPLTAGNEWLGYIGVTAKPSGYFDEEKQNLYRTLAEQGAVALRAARLRETIRGSQQRLSLLVQQSPLAFIELNTDLQVVSWNPAAERIFGYTRDQAQGRSVASLVVPEAERPIAEQNWHDLLAQQRSTRGTYNSLTQDGRLITCEWFHTPLFSAEGKAIGIAQLVQDVTERKRAEAQLERNLHETQVRFEVSQALAGAETEDEVLDVLIRQAGLYPQAQVAIFTLDMTASEPTFIPRRNDPFESGLPGPSADLRLPALHNPRLHRALSANRPFVQNNVLTDDETIDPSVREEFRQLGVNSFAAVPLTAGNEWLGYIGVTAKPSGYFDEEKQNLYRTLAEQGAVALQTARLRDQIQGSLTRRGYQVQTSTEVAQEIAAAPALEELFQRIVTLVKERFNYYHAQLFRYEPSLGAVVLVTGYGKAGEKMLAAGHKLAMGRGVVGTAADTGRPVLATDVTQDKDWRPNPNLPETKGELAVPIKLRDQVLGILDVQSDRPGALTTEDQLLLEGLCGQIAAAMESTRAGQELRASEAQMQETLRELERLNRATTREGWQAFLQTGQLAPAYRYDRTAVQPAQDLWMPQIEQAIQQNTLVPPSEENAAAVAPLSVRGAAIGALGVYDDPNHPLSSDELALLQEIVEQGALALESARLFENASNLAARERLLNEITARIRGSATVEGILNAAVREISRATGASFAAIDLELPEVS